MTGLVTPSPDYTSVKVDGVALTGVYQSPIGSFVSFSRDQAVQVEVTPTVLATSVAVRPYRADRMVTITNGKIRFDSRPGEKVSVEYNGDLTKPIYVFHNTVDTKTNAEYQADPNCLYYGPGEHVIGGTGEVVVAAGKTLFIAEGGVIRGKLRCGAGTTGGSRAATIKVRGRGIIDSTDTGTGGRPLRAQKVDGFDCEGPVFVGYDAWACVVNDCTNVDIRNIKIINYKVSPTGTPDGFDCVASSGVSLKDSFVRCYDDGVTIKNSKFGWTGNVDGVVYDNLVIWQGDGGNGVEIGWENDPTGSYIRNVRVSNINVIRKTNKTPTNRRAVISIHLVDGGDVSDIQYRNIKTESAAEGLIHFEIFKDAASLTPDIGSLTDVTVEGFYVLSGQSGLPITVKGYDASHKITNVRISGVVDQGVLLSTKEAANVTESNVTNFTWDVGTPSTERPHLQVRPRRLPSQEGSTPVWIV